MKILIIQQKMIGDVLISTILFEALKRKYPTSELHYVVNENTTAVVKNNPFIDKIIVVNKELQTDNKKFFTFARSFRTLQYDAVIDVYSKLSSNLITFFSKANLKVSKHKWYSSFIYSKTYPFGIKPEGTGSMALSDRMRLLLPFNIEPRPIKPKIYLDDSEIVAAKKLLRNGGIEISDPLIMVGILGSSELKTYPLAEMANILNHVVAKTNAQLIFNYIPNQKPEAIELYNLCSKQTQKAIKIDIFGRDLREFLSLTSHCNALIGNEGGAINMAKALQIPTFSIFSPWIPKEAWGTFEEGPENDSIHLKDIRPELYKNKTLKSVKDSVDRYYSNFPSTEIIKKLDTFLRNNIKF